MILTKMKISKIIPIVFIIQADWHNKIRKNRVNKI